jgi:colanic acid/amylovoran biosynthesis protein
MDAFLASRMHSAIFAISRGIPTMALAYQPKTIGTFELLGLGEYVREVQDVTGQEIADHLLRVVNHYDQEKAKFVSAAATARARVLACLDRTWKPLLTGAPVGESANWAQPLGVSPTTVSH